MADEGQQYTPEELEQIQELIEPLTQEPSSGVFAPMQEQFESDMREFEPEPEEPEFDMEQLMADSTLPEDGEPDADDAAGGPGLDLGDLGGDAPDDPGDFADLGGDAGDEQDPSLLQGEGFDVDELADLDVGQTLGGDDATPDAEDAGDFDLGDLGDPGGDAPDGEDASADAMNAGDLGDLGLDDGGFGDLLGGDEDTADTGPGDAADSDDLSLGLDDFQPDDVGDPAADAGDFGDLLGDTPDERTPATDEDFDLGDLGGDLGDPGETAEEDTATETGDEFDMPAESFGDTDFDLGESGDDPTVAAEATGDDFGLGDLGDFGGDADAAAAGGDFGDLDDAGDGGLGDLGDLGGDLGDFGGDAGGDLGADLGDFGGDTGDDLGGDLGDFGGDAGGDLGGDLGDFGEDDATAPAPAADAGGDDFDFGGPDLGGELGDFGDDLSVPPDISADPGELTLDTSDLADMSEQAQLESGIGDEFTDEDLAKIRQALTDYPPGIKKSVIDVVVNEKISQPDQRLLMNMIIDQAEPDQIADFIEARLGYRPDITPSNVTKEGVQIIYADELSPEEMARKRRRNKFILAGVGAAVLALVGTIGTIQLLRSWDIAGKYEQGLQLLYQARTDVDQRESLGAAAEEKFQEALVAAGGSYDSHYLNRYGIAYMKAGLYDRSFEKLFGRVTPAYGETILSNRWTDPNRRAPLITAPEKQAWPVPYPAPEESGVRVVMTDRSNIRRTVVIPGAYIVDRLRDGELRRQTLMNLARFHSYHAQNFVNGEGGRKYKNDDLAIDYYRLILTLMNRPNDVEAIAGIGDIHYNAGNFTEAALEYDRIIASSPVEIAGHAGLLNTFIEIWKRDGDPRRVLAKHREIRSLGLEEDLPIYLTTKLASFYIDLDEDELRIKYQVDPVDALSGLDVKDNALHLIELVFKKEEERDGETIEGDSYGEGFYQRGRYLMRQNESLRALRQFQHAHKHDRRHWLAVNAIGEYYKNQREFDKAIQYFEESIAIHKNWQKTAGNRPEDETLIAGDYGKILYNMGSIAFLRYAGFTKDAKIGFPDTRIYPAHGENQAEPASMQARRDELAEARKYFAAAAEEGIKDGTARTNMSYWIGWIDYVSGDFEGSLRQWEAIDPASTGGDADPVLLMGRGNAYFHTDQLRASLGSYLKLQSDFERLAQDIETPDSQNDEQRYLFLTLAAVYNNIGAVYEQEYNELRARGGAVQDLRELEENSLRYYYRAIESARQMNLDNEVARTNVRLAFQAGRDNRTREPIIDDWVPPVLFEMRDAL